MKRSPRRPRLVDVAKLAGVSEATASVVLNNRVGSSTRVSEETQTRVWEAARSLGYVANPLARHLAGGRNQLLAIFTFEPVFPIDRHDFYYPFLVGIEEEAARCGYNLLLVTSSNAGSDKRRIFVDGINQLQLAAGAILLGREDKNEVAALLDDGFPFVFIGRRDSPGDNISYAAADYITATADLVETLFADGHRSLAYIQSLQTTESSVDRKLGVDRAFERRGAEATTRFNWRGASGALTAEAIRDFLCSGVTAFIAENDELAARILELAQALELRCPEDFSLVVLGDPLSATASPHDWTCFSIPRRQMGSAAVRLLLDMLAQGDEPHRPLRVTLPCTYRPGSTTAPPPEHLPIVCQSAAVAKGGAAKSHPAIDDR